MHAICQVEGAGQGGCNGASDLDFPCDGGAAEEEDDVFSGLAEGGGGGGGPVGEAVEEGLRGCWSGDVHFDGDVSWVGVYWGRGEG